MLVEAFNNLTPISEEEMEVFLSKAERVNFKKGEYFATPDLTCVHLAVLQSGIFRAYHIHDGKEVTDYFNTTVRNPLVSSFASFLSQQTAKEYVQALTDSELLLISYESLQELYVDYKSFERLGRLLAEKNYLMALERIESLQYHSATDRYAAFLKQYPMLINQIPHHYIASYLGVTPESLSRIRKNSL